MGNHAYSRALGVVIGEVRNGVAISSALEKYPELFPRTLISLMVVGERTGALGHILATFADFYEEEVDNNLKDLTAVMEPALLLIMGLLSGQLLFLLFFLFISLSGISLSAIFNNLCTIIRSLKFFVIF
jgi:type IV pilus assembly protein PilC